MPAIHSSAANSLTFVLSLLETWVETKKAIELRAEKLQALCSFLDEALAETGADNPAYNVPRTFRAAKLASLTNVSPR